MPSTFITRRYFKVILTHFWDCPKVKDLPDLSRPGWSLLASSWIFSQVSLCHPSNQSSVISCLEKKIQSASPNTLELCLGKHLSSIRNLSLALFLHQNSFFLLFGKLCCAKPIVNRSIQIQVRAIDAFINAFIWFPNCLGSRYTKICRHRKSCWYCSSGSMLLLPYQTVLQLTT